MCLTEEHECYTCFCQYPLTYVPAVRLQNKEYDQHYKKEHAMFGSDGKFMHQEDNSVTLATVPEDTTELNDYAFAQCTFLTTINLRLH